MGLIKQLRLITLERTEMFLESVQTPELLFPRLLRELADKVDAAANAEAKAATAVRSAQRRLDAARGRLLRLHDPGAAAGAAAPAGDADAHKEIEMEQASLALAESAHAEAAQARQALARLLEHLKRRRYEILARARLARAERARRDLAGPPPSAQARSLLDLVARMDPAPSRLAPPARRKA